MNTGDFVYIDYVGRVKETGEIFDLTKEDLAKKEGVYNPEIKYKPIPIIVDAKFVLAGLNKALKEMKVGEKRKVEIKPEDAFGERNPSLIQLIPLSTFRNQKIEPKVGETINIGGFRGKIVSISGGRVKVDFNHPLAGKILEYEIEIVGEIKDNKEKVEAIVFYFTGIEKKDFEVKLKEKNVEIEFKKVFNLTKEAKEMIAKNIKDWVKIEEVRFTDVFK